MHNFPFTDQEWSPIQDVVLSILNADSAGDSVLKSSLRLELLDRLDGLLKSHGDHPVLLEAKADYSEDAYERAELYRRAIGLAERHGLPTLSIRLSFARLLVDLGDSEAALAELRACGGELPVAKEDERVWWGELHRDTANEAVDDFERVPLYRRAVEIASAYGQPTLYIRLCLVRFLLDEGEPAAALNELRACGGELHDAKEDERAWWGELLEEVGRNA